MTVLCIYSGITAFVILAAAACLAAAIGAGNAARMERERGLRDE